MLHTLSPGVFQAHSVRIYRLSVATLSGLGLLLPTVLRKPFRGLLKTFGNFFLCQVGNRPLLKQTIHGLIFIPLDNGLTKIHAKSSEGNLIRGMSSRQMLHLHRDALWRTSLILPQSLEYIYKRYARYERSTSLLWLRLRRALEDRVCSQVHPFDVVLTKSSVRVPEINKSCIRRVHSVSK